tara:strand:- start:90 stop:1847 length:1758 start_codon:yes stop_codon:yes gene_type:complete
MSSLEIVAEIACGHSGQAKRLYELTKAACITGVNSIKYQIFNLDERAEENTKEYEIFKKHLLEESIYRKAIEIARESKLRVYADIYGYSSLNIAENLGIDGVKIHAEDSTNYPLIKESISKFKTIIISCGGSTYKSLIELREFITPFLTNDIKIYIVDGIQLFPTKREGHSLFNYFEVLSIFKNLSQIDVGIADHIDPEDQYSFVYPCSAYTLGASYIEKHLTISRKDKWTDWQSAFNPNQLYNLVSCLKSINNSLNISTDYERMGIEYKSMFQKYPSIRNQSKDNNDFNVTDIVYKKIRNKNKSFITYGYIKSKLNSIKLNKEDPIVRFSNFSQRIGAIITVRMSSSRLPGKALMNINGIPSILVVLERVKRIIGVDVIVVATSIDEKDDKLADLLLKNQVNVYRGDLDSIPHRLLAAAEEYNLDHIIRITGDSICLDYESMSELIISHLDISPDCSMLYNAIFGTNKEIITKETLRFLTDRIKSKQASEYLEYFLKKPCLLKINEVPVQYNYPENILNQRLTLDYEEDLIAINQLYSKCKNGHLSNIKDLVKIIMDPSFSMKNSLMIQKNPFNLNLDLDVNYN